MSGTQRPVSKKAERIPNAASTPKERKAATSLNRFAAKAEIVVRLVKNMARPTRVRVISVDSVVVAPFLRSSLYRWSACKESSIPSANTKIGSKLENCDLAITVNPSQLEKLAK